MRGETAWTRRARAAKPEIKLTPGKGAADLTVPLEQILDAVVKVLIANRYKQSQCASVRQPPLDSSSLLHTQSRCSETTSRDRSFLELQVYLLRNCGSNLNLGLLSQDNRVVAFIKGTRTAPQCGFSHKVSSRLTALGLLTCSRGVPAEPTPPSGPVTVTGSRLGHGHCWHLTSRTSCHRGAACLWHPTSQHRPALDVLMCSAYCESPQGTLLPEGARPKSRLRRRC